MSQRAEKYARNMERRTGALEDRADRLEESRDKIGRKLGEYGHRMAMIESDISHATALHENEVEVRRRGEAHTWASVISVQSHRHTSAAFCMAVRLEEWGTTTVPCTGCTTLARPGAFQRLSLALRFAAATVRARSAGSIPRPMRSPHTPTVPGPP